MCAHYNVGQGFKEFLSLFDIEPDDTPLDLTCRPTDPIPVVLREPETDKIELAHPRWGLVPAWLTEKEAGVKMMHARLETVAEKPAYREAFRTRRCILPMEWFYEFDKANRYRIFMEDGSEMGVAGIWERNNSGLSCAMITTPTNDLMSQVHERMPAILKREDYGRWLDRRTLEPEKLALLVPRHIEGLKMERDGTRAGLTAKPKVTEQESLF